MKKGTLKFPKYFPASLINAFNHRANFYWERYEYFCNPEIILRQPTAEQTHALNSKYQLQYWDSFNLLETLTTAHEHIKPTIRHFNFDREAEWHQTISAIIIAMREFNHRRSPSLQLLTATKRARSHLNDMSIIAARWDIMVRELMEIVEGLPPQRRFAISCVTTLQERVERWKRKLPNSENTEVNDDYIKRLIHKVVSSRQFSRRTAISRTLGYYLTLPTGPPDDFVMIDLTPNIINGLICLTNLVLDDPNDVATYDTVRKAVTAVGVKEIRSDFAAWEERRKKAREDRMAAYNARKTQNESEG